VSRTGYPANRFLQRYCPKYPVAYLCAAMEWEYPLNDIDTAARQVIDCMGSARVVAFEGEMGAGKTTLIQAICRRMGVRGGMGSPTFSIINEYDALPDPIYHIDLYRCASADEAVRAGVEECLFSGCRCLVEWPSRAPGLFPDDTIRLSLTRLDDHTRKIVVN